MAGTANAETKKIEVQSGDFTFTLYEDDGEIGSVWLTGYVGSASEVIFPTDLVYNGKKYPIQELGSNIFQGNTKITKVTILNSYMVIYQDAFKGCTGLKELVVGNGIMYIEENAFVGCPNLAIHITDLEAWCNIQFGGYFAGRHSLYLNDEEIKDLVIPNTVTDIGNYAFYFSNLTSVNFGNNVTSIGNNAFAYCYGLTSIEIPNNVTEIGDGAFEGCSALTSVSIGSGVKSIGINAFNVGWYPTMTAVYITDLEAWCKIKFMDNPLTYAHHLFLNDKEITDLIIPNGVTSIGDRAFNGGTGFTSLTIPNSVTSIGNSAFYQCTGLTSLTIPNSVSSIGSFAFENCSGLISVTIGNGVTNMGERAFLRCSAITSVNLSCEIVDKWFSDDYSLPPLTGITLGEGVKTVKENAFKGFTNIKTIDISSTVTSIEARAFSGSDKLTDVTCRATAVPETDRTAFENSYPNYATLHVPAVSQTAYKETAPWSEFKEVVAIKQDLPVDAEQCATPTISYKNGKLSFASDTEGVEFLYQITDNDIKSGLSAEVSLDATYHISVYATKEGYKDSETATATLCWIDQKPATEGITDGIANIPAKALLIKNNGGQLTVEGAADGEAISVYTVNGVQSGSAISQNGAASIYTNLQAGRIAIVKIGDKSVKVVIK